MAKLYEMFWQGTLGLEWIWDGGDAAENPSHFGSWVPSQIVMGFFKNPSQFPGENDNPSDLEDGSKRQKLIDCSKP